MIKNFLSWLFQKYEPEPKSSVDGKVIRCHDCGKYGYFAVNWDFDFEYEIPSSWHMVWYRFKPLFLCEKCQQKRRDFAKNLIN